MAAGRGWRSEAVVAEAAVPAEHGYAIRYRSLPGLHQDRGGGEPEQLAWPAKLVRKKASEEGAGGRGRLGPGADTAWSSASTLPPERATYHGRAGKEGERARRAGGATKMEIALLLAAEHRRGRQAAAAATAAGGRRGERTDQAAGCRQTDRGRPRPAGRSLVASAGPGRCSQRPRESRGGCTVGARSHAHWITVQRDSASQSPRLARLPSESYVGRV